ncbi:alpha-(1,3)-fucosyltransferase C isoform X1 [Papilio machaon]|uniref:alpha-(1,3)-fucosyltransferase C isoform X1 n=2 Tax=Papilio machaon TaxID=76193 RepID=UPI001E662A95|nr:alpha-(1,3)-fucosyltransferase C isoform X1 [Papilio machaon]
MRNQIYVKLFFSCTVLSILVFLYLSLKDLTRPRESVLINTKIYELEQNIDKIIEKVSNTRDKMDTTIKNLFSNESDLKYILQWTSSKNVPFVYMGEGRKGFIDRKCPYTNCFVTGDKKYLGDYTKFDLIAFAGPEVVRMNNIFLPTKRSPHQKYVFATIESADNYPVCSNRFDGFFNWTWTYRLDSEAKWGYIVIRDSDKKIIGPKKDMNWMKLEEMNPVTEELKMKLKSKTKAAAWFISNCYSRSGRERFVKELQGYLKQYKLDVDIYGACGPLKCGRDHEDECYNMIEKDYYFYLAFENSFSEDYVTEKLLHGLKHNAVPIVYGGANYTRFMPDGIYLNARDLGFEKLAVKMYELIKSPEKYAEYFRWKDHYSYYRRHESLETDDYCRFCSILNEDELVKKTTIYKHFRKWWDPPNRC